MKTFGQGEPFRCIGCPVLGIGSMTLFALFFEINSGPALLMLMYGSDMSG